MSDSRDSQAEAERWRRAPEGCSCHPDDKVAYNIVVCPRHHALRDCRLATMAAEIERLHKLITQMARDSDAEFARLTGVAFDVRAATIEECAQIAQREGDNAHWSNIVAAIRALKEQQS